VALLDEAQSPATSTFEVMAGGHGAHVRHTTVEAIRSELADLQDRGVAAGTSAEIAALLGIAPRAGEPTSWDTWFSLGLMGIAATGTVAVAERDPAERIPALLCRRHIVVLRADTIVPALADAAALLRGWIEDGRRYITFVSGPSRTADIEKVLTVGAHGPAQLDLFLVAQWGND
jgi:L-lactate dehydrogenase complex protein LldG